MEETNSFSTIIVHEVRLKLGLSCNEYCVVDLIDWSMEETGWCELSRQDIATMMGLSKQAMVKILDRLLKDALIYKSGQTRKLCSTDLWKDHFAKSPKIITTMPDLTPGKDEQLFVNNEKPSNFIDTWRPARVFIPFTN